MKELIKGEDFAFDITLTDDENQPVEIGDLDDIIFTFLVNKKPFLKLSLEDDNVSEGVDPGEIYVQVDGAETAKIRTGILSVEVVVKIDDDVQIFSGDVYKLVNSEFATDLL